MNVEILTQIEIIFGSIGIILGLFFGIFLLQSRRSQPHANLFLAIYLLAFSLRIGKSVFHNYFEIDATLRTVFLTVLLCVGPSLWLYTKHRLKPHSRKSRSEALHFVPFLLLLSTSWLIPNDGTSFIFVLFYNGLTAHIFGYCMFALLWFLKQKDPVRSEEEAKTKIWLRYFLLINLVVIILYFLISQLIIPFYIGISFLFSLVVVFFSIWALKNPFLFKIPREKYRSSYINDQTANELMQRLHDMMKEEKPYLDPQLTQVKLSESMDVSVKELSQVINQIAFINYSEFISGYRVEEAKRLLTSPSHANFTIAAIAYECGFNSISSFNALFKKHAGMTAIVYQKSHQ